MIEFFVRLRTKHEMTRKIGGVHPPDVLKQRVTTTLGPRLNVVSLVKTNCMAMTVNVLKYEKNCS